ncbi:hypothetical protein [Streptomyces sp. NPDC058612]|uniref:golvesin C-terminal-like domain-containing protein n=1 Tax=Streptomyces sp. NPDC058612 TaxID=3346555 RepID=UPI00364B57B5
MAAGALFAGLLQVTAWADDKPRPAPAPAKPFEVPAKDRAKVLGEDWKKSADIAWTTSSDAQGFHLLTAHERAGYAWSTVASLSEPGFDTDSWIGNACVTASGKRAVAVYAPRTFTNTPKLMARGAFAAVVELETGHVTKLPVQVSLSYYNPGCGTGEEAVLTQSGGEDKASTRLFKLDTVTATLSDPIETTGQVTSSVPTSDGSVVGAAGAQIVKIGVKGDKTPVVATDTVPYRLTPDSDGGLVFLDKGPAKAGAQVARVKRVAASQVRKPGAKKAGAVLLAEGPPADTGLTRNASTVYLTGKAKPASGKKLPKTVRHLDGAPKDAKVSTRGEAVLTGTTWSDGQGALVHGADPSAGRSVEVQMTVLDSGRATAFTVAPDQRTSPRIQEGRERTPALKAPKSDSLTAPKAQPKSAGPAPQAAAPQAAAAGGPNEVVESERVCSVPRNDPRNQAMQPKPRQVEWAVNQAIRGNLNKHVNRPANWKNLGMPAYQPQTLFPYPSDLLGGATIPAQVMLGITAQESNMWQASRVAVPGVTANPLIGNYYGIDLYDGNAANDWDVNWADADCGYGITQVTDHMRLAGREDGKGGAAWDYQKQRAVALDYTANVAAGLQILADKWHQTSSAGLKVNNGNSAKLENWTFALWAYNSGFYPDKGDGSPWGLGWANNPANPEWDAGRSPFMEDTAGNEEAADAAKPQHWPYQEKVLGFAAHPPAFLESPGKMVPAFRAAWWNGKEGGASIEGSAVQNRAKAKPSEDMFCTPLDNSCDPSKIGDGAANETGSGPCIRDVDYKCWWHKSVQWKNDCDFSCGNDFTRFPADWAEEADGTAYPPNCTTSGLPAGARIVDDVPQGTPVMRPGCSNSSWTNQGSFTMDFGTGETSCSLCYVKWPAKVDLHQLGAGFGGHFYFGHTRKADAKGERLKITGTWKLNAPLAERDARVWVHLPDHGAQTKQAKYEIKTAEGWVSKQVSQPGTSNRWVDIGVYRFEGNPEVRLSSITADGTGDQDIAFDAVAFEPGDFSQIPEIRFPDPDPNAPAPAAVEPPEIIPGNFLDLNLSVNRSAPAAKSSLVSPGGTDPKPSRECRTVNEAKQEVLCMGPAPATPRPADRQSGPKEAAQAPTADASTRAASGAGETVTCSLAVASVSYTRTYACMTGQLILERITAGRPTGQAIWDYRHEIQLNLKTEVIQQTVSFDMKSVAGIKNVTLDMDFDCLGACQSEPTQWTNSRTWQAGDKHTLTGFKQTKWTGTSGHSDVYPSWTFKGTMDGGAGSPIKRDKSELNIRCDLEAKNTNSKPGCVFSRYIPTYVVPTAENPSAAAFYWILQQKLPSHPGSREHKKPLTYLADSVKAEYNRNKVVCKKSGEGKFLKHPDSGVTKPGGPSCDEYPFAATYQSGAMPVATGGGGLTLGTGCLQLYAKKPTGTEGWTMKEDTRYARPNTWKEPCGRASLPGDENSGAANRIGLHFVPNNRIIDKDAYYLLAPGFEECTDLTKLCWVRTR